MRDEESRRPPGPPGHWLRGNSPAYEADRIGFLRRCHREYGDVFSFDEQTVCVVDPDLAHEVLTRTGSGFLTELPPFDARPDLDGAAAQAHAWMSARRTVWPGLNHTAAAAHDGRIVQILDTIVGPAAGHEIDVLAMTHRFTAEAVTDYCFGPGPSEIPGLLRENADAVERFAAGSHRLPAFIPRRRDRRFFRVHRRTVDTLTRIVGARRAEGAGTPPADLLDQLLDADPRLPDRTVVSTLRGVLLGGHGVPAAALASIVRELALRPGLAAELRDEAGGTAGGCAPPPARLRLAEAVVREVLRLYPPAWLMTRTARTAQPLARWSLRPGDEVLLPAYLIHRDPRWWRRPDDFDPGRWLAGRPARGTTYLPFGAGPRVCLGAALAMRQLSLATSRLAQRYTITSSNATSAVPKPGGRLAPDGLRARLQPVVPHATATS
ncbi:cytochrome P450 [Micromonospora sp. C31]|uniref:cytochrome P450 n=1 Tax=Micromonospora sp. C31 TaxID=2824876 RepID=UPI001B3841C5|nr:cytochrome P450 [Micromonospora sp. C31]MBQ1076612.1 cytochrome P450 [Micromonospora sp. C31]